MRGEHRQGRFTIDHERYSIIEGTTKELVRTVGNVIQWWFYDPVATVVDDIYDVGSSASGGGRRWNGPVDVPVVNASIFQGMTSSNDGRGFYNTDMLSITINMDVIRNGTDLKGNNLSTIPELSKIEINPDHYLLDRVVFRNQVFQPIRVNVRGIITDKYTLITVECTQVNPEELVNDAQFAVYAGYLPSNPIYGYGAGAYGAGRYGIGILE